MGLADMAILAFYGMDRVRFIAPAKIGDTLREEMEVAEKVDRKEKEGIVTLKVTVMNQKDEAVASMGMKLLMAGNLQGNLDGHGGNHQNGSVL